MAKTKKTPEKTEEIEQVEKKVKTKSITQSPAPTATLKDLLDQGSESVISEEALLEENNDDQIGKNINEVIVTPIVNVYENTMNSENLITPIIKEEIQEDLPETSPEEHKRKSEAVTNLIENLATFFSTEQTSENTQKDDVVEGSENNKQTFELSQNAKSYKAYIEMYKMTPEEFLAKYPKHKSKIFIEEIIEWKIKTGQQ